MTKDDATTEKSLTGADFPVLRQAITRWADNDMFGHLNNAVYYQLFDAAINGWLIEESGIDVLTTPYLGVVAESGCRFYREVGFPVALTTGLRVTRLGRSSVTYRLAILPGAAAEVGNEPVAAVGQWVHVYIDRISRQATDIPLELRALMERAS